MTAVIVAHDGATWLPGVADALLDQTRAVQRVVAVDTGSRDRSGAVLASKFGQASVFGMDRATGYGAAVARALSHRAANLPVQGASGSQQADRIEWIWLLHDDCEPAPDALEQLLRGAAEAKAAAVLGPKLRDWSNREVISEAGVTLDTAARRLTGIEPREVDQGQHDGDRDALAVSSAGMLVRRDVWEQVGGFDVGMGLFMEDIDFCWRVHSAGYRVRVITDAICYHAQAAAKRRRAISVGRRGRMLDRRNGLFTLLGNLPFPQMVNAAVGNIVVSFLRIAFFLVAKRLTAALDEAAAASAVLCHPFKLIGMRSRRARGRRAAYSRVKADLPPGHSVRRLVEYAATMLAKSGPTDSAGAHHASADPTEDESLLVDNGLGRRLLTSPTLLSSIALIAVALFATRSLLGSGPLGGGSLIPAWGGASDLWQSYLQSFHPSGLGSATSAPPYVAIIAVLATVLAGKPWLAIDVVLIGCVPLAGITAMLAVRRITSSVGARVWASVTYALLPVATGVIAAGRFGSAVAFVLLPLIALAAGQVITQSGQRASRAAWATGLLVAIGAAFVPMLWIVALLGCAVTAVALRTTRPGLLRNLAVVALAAPVLLLPWTLTLINQPSALLLEAGLPQPGALTTGLSGRMLLLLNPGGPGLPPYWVTGGLLAVALLALFVGRRRALITAGWGVALAGLLLAVVTSHLIINPPDGGRVVVWAGLPIAIAALGLLLAASVGAEALGRRVAAAKTKGLTSALGTGRGFSAALIALVGFSTPLLAAAFWLSTGVRGPVHPVTSQVVPQLVAVADGQSRQVRTLVLTSDRGRISYLLLRGPSPSLADSELTTPPAARRALARVVAVLTTPDGGLAVNQSQLLADFDIGYVLVEAPVSPELTRLLNDVSGLRTYSTTPDYSIWQLITPPARVTVVEPNGTVVPVPSGQVGVSGAPAPSSGGTLMLAEPVGGWSASVNGQPLIPVMSPAGSWAQAYRLPAGGGSLSISHSGLVHDAWLIFEALAAFIVIGLALPGVHVAEDVRRAEASAAEAAERTARGSAALPRGARRAAGSQVAASTASGTGAGRSATTAVSRAGAAASAAAGLASARTGRAVARGRTRLSRAKSAGDEARTEAASGGRAGTRGPNRDGAGRTRPGEQRTGAGTGRDDHAGREGPRGTAVDWERPDGNARPRPGRRSADDNQPLPTRAELSDLTDLVDRRDRSAGRAIGPQARAWPYQDEPEPPVSPPARPPAARSPSGAAPPVQWSRRPADDGDAFGSGRYDRDDADLRGAGRRGGGSGQELARSDTSPPPDRQPPSRGRLGRRAGGGRGHRRRGDQRDPASTSAGSLDRPDRYQPDRSGTGRYNLDRRQDDRYEPRSSEREADRYLPARYERGDSADGIDMYGAGRRGGGYEPDLADSGRHRTGRRDDSGSYERPSRARRGDDRYEPDDQPGRLAGLARLGRRSRVGAGQSDRRGQAEALEGWPGAGGDSLEPLPPLAGPGQAGSSRADTWRPDARGGGPGWDDDYGSDRDGGRRWSSADQDYEGDTW